MDNEYDKRKAQLQKDRCKTCHGLGTCDDLEPGDTGGNSWTCEECQGTGITITINTCQCVDDNKQFKNECSECPR